MSTGGSTESDVQNESFYDFVTTLVHLCSLILPTPGATVDLFLYLKRSINLYSKHDERDSLFVFNSVARNKFQSDSKLNSNVKQKNYSGFEKLYFEAKRCRCFSLRVKFLFWNQYLRINSETKLILKSGRNSRTISARTMLSSRARREKKTKFNSGFKTEFQSKKKK